VTCAICLKSRLLDTGNTSEVLTGRAQNFLLLRTETMRGFPILKRLRINTHVISTVKAGYDHPMSVSIHECHRKALSPSYTIKGIITHNTQPLNRVRERTHDLRDRSLQILNLGLVIPCTLEKFERCIPFDVKRCEFFVSLIHLGNPLLQLIQPISRDK
jgi:hypothetical protein